MMKNKKQNAFTLTELIVVIVIIGILSGVLIPTISGYVKKAKLATDKTLIKNINSVISLEIIEGNINEDAVDIRDIIEEKGLTFNATTPGYDIWYNKTSKSVELLTTDEMNDKINPNVSADAPGANVTINLTPLKPEECLDGYILLNTTGSIYSEICNDLRNINNYNFNDIYNKITKLDKKNMQNAMLNFIASTLFISQSGIYYIDYVNPGTLVYHNTGVPNVNKTNILFCNDVETFMVNSGEENIYNAIKVIEIPKTITVVDLSVLNAIDGKDINLVIPSKSLLNAVNKLAIDNEINNAHVTSYKDNNYNNTVTIYFQ